ncbi:hypothetical protein, partial [Cobetia sp. MC34]|uniref:hypothetical protein n=1 Tax=Cobetia sp. MC34 TaxID=2785080 RepID=UPI001BC92E2E
DRRAAFGHDSAGRYGVDSAPGARTQRPATSSRLIRALVNKAGVSEEPVVSVMGALVMALVVKPVVSHVLPAMQENVREL